ncbi:hypothetical protein FDP41_000619 [Naegleria fowleri]|uniref:Cytochrome b5 heme-binding domain-containing protein n=1 Tax=Naegleria fowleri TaxID=5763 RepID=A0A6A5BY58_NAEFO|nr:uncharacterized protein FDP41_001426 [Naegleria fowleri]XP_044569433.1 uncharacterized protein FDP41_000619 [Naegleria fowleri]KAF0979562.1 hypothetical protein FDP41_001426 [Naegleria fowleri]KAF0984720.1 hypothetical protein FDP41_000619 [Naegleria fowleri]CAG4716635.1 unnamed protein product [Naegleria fowleri]
MATTTTRIITLEELAEHKEGHKDPWICIDGKVYSIAEYKDEHPGGEDVLFEVAGKDGTEEFNKVGHGRDAFSRMKDLLVGELKL